MDAPTGVVEEALELESKASNSASETEGVDEQERDVVIVNYIERR